MGYLEKLEMLPRHMQHSVRDYIEKGRKPGGFLQALLSNNLIQTFSRADDVNTRAIHDYIIYLYNYAPSGCYGSPEKMNAWIEQGGLEGKKA